MRKSSPKNSKRRNIATKKAKPVFRSWGLAKRLEHVRNKEK